MCIEEVIDRAIYSRQTIEIEYCTLNGRVFSCKITDIGYSNYYGGGYIVAYRTDMGEDRTFMFLSKDFRMAIWPIQSQYYLLIPCAQDIKIR